MEKKEEYISIKNIEDIITKVPQENIDDFLNDLKSWLEYHHSMSIFEGIFPGQVIIQKKEFKRINDGKHNAEITIKYKPSSTN